MNNPANQRLCYLGALGGLVGSSLLWHRLVTLDAHQWAMPAQILTGFAFLSLIAARRGGWMQALVGGCVRLGLTTGITFGVAEGACRALKLDFNELLGARRANEAFPIYFRLPTHPSGDVFFTRTPGATWTGKPLQTLLKNHRSTDVAYTDEQELTVKYSKQGFRNPDSLTDWDIAVVGDSFTESGYLPEDQIFTGVAAARLGRRVKNLGITDTGGFSHVHYLEAYGAAPSCRKAVLAFFEGNDLSDNVHELEDLERFQQTGERPSHDIPVQPSLLKAVWNILRDFKQLRLSDRSYANAWFKAGDREIPVTLADAPPSMAQLSLEQRNALASVLDRFAEAARKQGVKPHLLYLPCKRRVLHGHLRHGEGCPEPGWQPGDLPDHVYAECQKRGIGFINPTGALASASAQGRLTFNPIYDTHNNREGHQIIGEVLAEALK